ncbi:unnamed protein product [Symbiodinium natans]|uniref:Uncharacterized protein n=1 Tax=Symbiodinium natans TaxID=878477 RepID=A0A812QTF3_9DINO|nr:unnamed protein product [Symbiodinium natans]
MDLEGDGEIGEPMGLRERASTVQAPRASQVSETWTRRRTEEPVYSKDLSPTERRLGNVEKYDHELGAFCMPPKIDEGSEPLGS